MPSPALINSDELSVDLPIPKVRLDKVGLDCARIREALTRWHGFVLTPGLCRTLAVHLEGSLSVGRVDDAITQTLAQYTNQKLDDDLIAYLARQFIARRAELTQGPILKSAGFSQPEWVPYEITRLVPDVWKSGHPAQVLSLYALHGTPSGKVFEKKMKESWLSMFAYKVGYNRRLIYPDMPQQLLGLRFWAFMQPDPEDPKQLLFKELGMDPRMKKANQIIIRRRNRLDLELDETDKEGDPKEWACPKALDIYCEGCPQKLTSCSASYYRDNVRHISA